MQSLRLVSSLWFLGFLSLEILVKHIFSVFYRNFLGFASWQKLKHHWVIWAFSRLWSVVATSLSDVGQSCDDSILGLFAVRRQLCVETLENEVAFHDKVGAFFWVTLMHFPPFLHFHQSELVQKLPSSWFADISKPWYCFRICNQFFDRINIDFLQALSELLIWNAANYWVWSKYKLHILQVWLFDQERTFINYHASWKHVFLNKLLQLFSFCAHKVIICS